MQHEYRGRATIEDVAAAADVSVATVSRALRGLANVAPSTRDRVQEAAARLDYRPNPSASRLAAGRTRTVGVVVPLLNSWYFSQVMSGAEAVLSDTGYDFLVIAIADAEARERIIKGMAVGRVDGLILVDIKMPTGEAEFASGSGIALVTIGFQVDGASAVVVDDCSIGQEATSHLLERGHERIALLAGTPGDPFGFVVPAARQRGYRAALDTAGITHDPDLEVDGAFTVEGGRIAMESLLRLDDPPTAVFAMSDEMAIGAWRAIGDAGLSVPADISVIGVDNHEMADVIGITTIQQEVMEHGAVAARLLIGRLDEATQAPVTYHATTKLIERSSTGPPPS